MVTMEQGSYRSWKNLESHGI